MKWKEKYTEIRILDDTALEAIGTIGELQRFTNQFDEVFVAIGNVELCEELYNTIEKLGASLVILTAYDAYISSTS